MARDEEEREREFHFMTFNLQLNNLKFCLKFLQDKLYIPFGEAAPSQKQKGLAPDWNVNVL